jgi:hypothetical protein
MKAKHPKERNIKDVLARENFAKVVLMARMVPVEEIAPKRIETSQTIVRRMTMAYILLIFGGMGGILIDGKLSVKQLQSTGNGESAGYMQASSSVKTFHEDACEQ